MVSVNLPLDLCFRSIEKMFEKKKKVVFQEVFGKARAAGLVNP